MGMLISRYDGSGSIREHIMSLSDMATKLKGMDMALSTGFLAHFITTSLPSELGVFKVSYNT